MTAVNANGLVMGLNGHLVRPEFAALQPRQIVPEGMLDYPPCSTVAKCVGWYLTGGKRQRTKKEQRAKERWDGTWREFNPAGDRNMREADNILDVLKDGFTFNTSGQKLTIPEAVDWDDESMNVKEPWQPTPTLTGLPVDEVVPVIPTRQVNHLDYGRFQHLPLLYGLPEFAKSDSDKLLREIRTDLDGAWKDHDGDDVTGRERPSKMIKDLCLGEDMAAEAYLQSVNAFVSGATQSVRREDRIGRGSKRKRTAEVEEQEVDRMNKVKMEDDETLPSNEPNTSQNRPAAARLAEYERYDSARFDLGMSLEDYVKTKWRGGWLDAGMRGTVRRVQEAYVEIQAQAHRDEPACPPEKKAANLTQDMETKQDIEFCATPAVVDSDDSSDFHDLERSLFRQVVSSSIKSVPILSDLETYAARRTGLDLACLLHTATDFSLGGSSLSLIHI